MGATVKVIGDHTLGHMIPAFVIQHQAAENGLFSLQRVRGSLSPSIWRSRGASRDLLLGLFPAIVEMLYLL